MLLCAFQLPEKEESNEERLMKGNDGVETGGRLRLRSHLGKFCDGRPSTVDGRRSAWADADG